MIIQLSLYFSSLANHFFLCVFVDAAQVLLLPRQRDIVLCHCVFFFFFLGRLGEGFKKKINNKWLEKKKEQNGEFAILFLNPILSAQIFKKNYYSVYFGQKSSMMLCGFFFCVLFLSEHFFFFCSLNTMPTVKRKTTVATSMLPQESCFKKIKSALVIQLPTNFKLTLQNRCKPMDGDRLLYLCCCTY